MKAGDLVRFRSSCHIKVIDGVFGFDDSSQKWFLGLLMEYKPWEKVATVMYNGAFLRIHASELQKAGRRDERV